MCCVWSYFALVCSRTSSRSSRVVFCAFVSRVGVRFFVRPCVSMEQWSDAKKKTFACLQGNPINLNQQMDVQEFFVQLFEKLEIVLEDTTSVCALLGCCDLRHMSNFKVVMAGVDLKIS